MEFNFALEIVDQVRAQTFAFSLALTIRAFAIVVLLSCIFDLVLASSFSLAPHMSAQCFQHLRFYAYSNRYMCLEFVIRLHLSEGGTFVTG